MNPPLTPTPDRPSVLPATPPAKKTLPMPDEAAVKALEEYFARLEAAPPGEEPEWRVEDLFPSSPR